MIQRPVNSDIFSFIQIKEALPLDPVTHSHLMLLFVYLFCHDSNQYYSYFIVALYFLMLGSS